MNGFLAHLADTSVTAGELCYGWDRLSRPYSDVSYVVQRQVTLMNIRQLQKTSAALMCSQLTGLLSFLTSAFLPPPQGHVSFRNWRGTLRLNVSFLSQMQVIISLLFIFFLWLWSSDSSFLSSETKQAFKPRKLQLSVSLILRGGDGGRNKQLILQKYCLFKSQHSYLPLHHKSIFLVFFNFHFVVITFQLNIKPSPIGNESNIEEICSFKMREISERKNKYKHVWIK